MTCRNGAFALVVTAAAALLPAQAGAAPPPAGDLELAGQLQKLKEAVLDRKLARDAEALDLIGAVLKKWEAGLGDKDKAAVVKALGGVFTLGRLRSPDQAQLYLGAAVALGRLGKDGARPLQEAFADGTRFPEKREWVSLREKLLVHLGRTKDEAMIPFLLKLARGRSPEPALLAAAGEALGNFDDSSEALRKDIVSNLLGKYGELDSKARVIDPNNIEAQNARSTLTVIAGRWNDALRRLTRASFDQFPQWNEWYNKNKGRSWK